MPRTAISKKRRFEVFKRDGFTCQYCGGHPPSAILHVDHIVPVAGGGGNEESNLVTSCDACNLGKGARLLSSIPQSLGSKAAEVAERESQIKGYTAIMRAEKERIHDDAWAVADIWMNKFSRQGIDKGYFQSIIRFVQDLGVVEVESSMELAVSRQPSSQSQCFRYFCGVCWNKIKEMT